MLGLGSYARRPPVDDERMVRFEAVYRETYGRITAYAVRRCGSPQDVADVVAETFTVAWRRIAEVPPGREALLWLYGVARRAGQPPQGRGAPPDPQCRTGRFLRDLPGGSVTTGPCGRPRGSGRGRSSSWSPGSTSATTRFSRCA
ncbi:RNA polymerase sigma factor [Streptosporangium saharense]|uniref:RNA polymerase sigma factor n=1 Tax=Streptosporangium saharense TaxID=1706840 RepID=UPI00332AB259